MSVLWMTGLGSCLVIVLGVAAVLAAIRGGRRR